MLDLYVHGMENYKYAHAYLVATEHVLFHRYNLGLIFVLCNTGKWTNIFVKQRSVKSPPHPRHHA
jgi:hypothetical protein